MGFGFKDAPLILLESLRPPVGFPPDLESSIGFKLLAEEVCVGLLGGKAFCSFSPDQNLLNELCLFTG